MSLSDTVYACEVALAKTNTAHEKLWQVQEGMAALGTAQLSLQEALKKLRTEKASAYQVPSVDNPLYTVMLEKNALANRCAELERELTWYQTHPAPYPPRTTVTVDEIWQSPKPTKRTTTRRK